MVKGVSISPMAATLRVGSIKAKHQELTTFSSMLMVPSIVDPSINPKRMALEIFIFIMGSPIKAFGQMENLMGVMAIKVTQMAVNILVISLMDLKKGKVNIIGLMAKSILVSSNKDV